MKKVKLTKEAANCLAWFIGHSMYGDTLSEVVVDLTEEWAARERKSLTDLHISDDEYEDYLKS